MFRSTSGTPPGKAPERRARGVLPIQVTPAELVLAKSSLSIRNSYEIRQALVLATEDGKRLVLKVPPGATVDDWLRAEIEKQGGAVIEGEVTDYSVYFGHVLRNGYEVDGWVFGEAAAYRSFVDALKSAWLKEHLRPGLTIADIDLMILESELRSELIDAKNIDGENVKLALGNLAKSAKSEGGLVFVQ